MANLFDSSAVIAFIDGEPGADRAAALIDGGFISAVNASEVITVLMRRSISFESAKASLHQTRLTPIEFTIELAELGARLSGGARGISLGDRACMATGLRAGLTVVTADRAWANLKIDSLKIEFIR